MAQKKAKDVVFDPNPKTLRRFRKKGLRHRKHPGPKRAPK